MYWGSAEQGGDLGRPEDYHGEVDARADGGGGDYGGEAAGTEKVHWEEGVAFVVESIVDYEYDYA